MTERFKDWDEVDHGSSSHWRRQPGSFERWGWPTSLLSGPWHLSRRLGNNLASFGKRKMRRWSLTAEDTPATEYLGQRWQIEDMHRGQTANNVASVDGRGYVQRLERGARQGLIKARPM